MKTEHILPKPDDNVDDDSTNYLVDSVIDGMDQKQTTALLRYLLGRMPQSDVEKIAVKMGLV